MKVEKKITPWKLGRRGWHSKDWKKKKWELRRMKKGKTSREGYIRKKKEYKAWCEEEKEKYEQEEKEKIRSIKTEEKAWKYINKFRKKKERESRRKHKFRKLKCTLHGIIRRDQRKKDNGRKERGQSGKGWKRRE